MTRVIKKNLEQENKKYYYILILNILKKYDNISDEEIKKALEIYKNKPRRSKRIKDKSGKDEVKDEEEIDHSMVFSIYEPDVYYYNHDCNVSFKLCHDFCGACVEFGLKLNNQKCLNCLENYTFDYWYYLFFI